MLHVAYKNALAKGCGAECDSPVSIDNGNLALLGDSFAFSALLMAEKEDLPLAMLNVTNLFARSRDTAPGGLALAPSSTTPGRFRNRSLNWLVLRVLLRDVNRHVKANSWPSPSAHTPGLRTEVTPGPVKGPKVLQSQNSIGRNGVTPGGQRSATLSPGLSPLGSQY